MTTTIKHINDIIDGAIHHLENQRRTYDDAVAYQSKIRSELIEKKSLVQAYTELLAFSDDEYTTNKLNLSIEFGNKSIEALNKDLSWANEQVNSSNHWLSEAEAELIKWRQVRNKYKESLGATFR